MARHDYFYGGVLDLRKILGSIKELYEAGVSYKPEAFSLSDSEFRQLIAQKEVYAVLENHYELKRRLLQRLSLLKEITEKILVRLDGL